MKTNKSVKKKASCSANSARIIMKYPSDFLSFIWVYRDNIFVLIDGKKAFPFKIITIIIIKFWKIQFLKQILVTSIKYH